MAEVGHVARGLALALLLAGCAPAAPAASPCPGTADGAIAALPLPPHQDTGDFRHLLLTDAAQDFCAPTPAPVPAYFQLNGKDGRPRYTRRGAFQLVLDGENQWIRHESGLDPSPLLAVRKDATTFEVTTEGVLKQGGDELGSIFTWTFPRPEALEHVGDGLYVATPAAGEPTMWSGRMIGAPQIRQGMLFIGR